MCAKSGAWHFRAQFDLKIENYLIPNIIPGILFGQAKIAPLSGGTIFGGVYYLVMGRVAQWYGVQSIFS